MHLLRTVHSKIRVYGRKKSIWRSRYCRTARSSRAFVLVSIQPGKSFSTEAPHPARFIPPSAERDSHTHPSRSPIFAVLLVNVEGPRHSKFIVRWSSPSCPHNLADRRDTPREFVAGSKPWEAGGYSRNPNVTKYRMHYAWGGPVTVPSVCRRSRLR